MAKNEAKIRFTAETGEFNSAIKKSNEEMSKLRAELKLNETQMQSTGASVEGLEEKHRILSAQLKASESKTEALAQKVNKAAEIFGENSTEVNKLRTQLLNAQTAQAKMEQAVEACKNALEDQRAAASKAESATEKLTNTIDNQQTELNKLKSEYVDAVLQYGKTSSEAKALARQIDSLSDDLSESKKQMSAAEDAADKLDNSLDEVGEGAREASEGFTVMKGAMADLVADGITKVADGLADITTEAFTMANDIDKATNTFIAKTGESADSAGEFEDVMKSIYGSNYGESFEDISDAMATVKTSMGDIGTVELENLTTQALILRDTFDMDVNESIRAVNSVMDQFGVSADEAYNLIAQGAQKGLNQNGDLLDTVNEYSVQFKNAGYSAEDMFNMLANGVDAGTWSVDKLGDAVKEFNIRASDGTVGQAIKDNAKAFGMTATEAKALAKEVESGSVGAYKKLADQLKSVDDDTQRYQLGVEMFGTMWEDLGEDAVFALLNTQGEISTTSNALKDINSVKYNDLGSALEGIGRNLKTSLAEPIQNEVMPAVNEFIEDVDWEGVGESVGSAFGAVVEGAVALATAVKDATQWMTEHKALMATVGATIAVVATAITAYNAVQAVKTAMDAAQVTTVWGLVAAHWAQATAAMAAIAPYILVVAAIAAVIAIIVLLIKNWDSVVEACKNAWEAVKDTLSQWGEWIDTNVIQPVKDFFSGLWDSVSGFVSDFGKNASKKFSETKEKISSAASNAKDKVVSAFSGMKDKASSLATSAKDKTVSAWNTLKDKTASAYNSAKDKAVSAFSGLKDKASSLATSAKDKAVSAWNSMKDKTSSVFSTIKSVISSGASGALSVVSSKFNSIKSKISGVMNSAKSVVSNAISKIKGFFNFNWSLPKIKLPHFSISGKFSLNPPSIPKFSVSWYKDGAIFTKPTLFNTPFGMKGVGEAGAEAVLPIDRLEGYISGAIEKAQNVVNLDSLAAAIEDLANRPMVMNINGRQFATATASDGDSVNGLRSSFKSRGLALD